MSWVEGKYKELRKNKSLEGKREGKEFEDLIVFSKLYEIFVQFSRLYEDKRKNKYNSVANLTYSI
jgi:hypothetical protein